MNSSLWLRAAFLVAASSTFVAVTVPLSAVAGLNPGTAVTALPPVGGPQAARKSPQRILVPAPAPRAPMALPPAASIHRAVSRDVRVAHGAPGRVPRMLQPREIDRVLTAARERATRTSGPGRQHVEPQASRATTHGDLRSGAPSKSAVRATKSVNAGAGTGINPWWRYQEQKAAGGGHVMVNVGTGNMLLQENDMAVPHKGMSLAFRRTYNSQSQHDVAGTDGTEPSMYGNGWTSTFDAHLSGSTTGTISVWDIDGARYDYTLAADGVTRVAPPGQYATLVSDGGCGYMWTKKSGTTYYFWTPDGAGPCASWWYPQYGAYAGRTYQIIGRNRNTYITFYYSWDNGNSAVGGKISQVQAVTESGMTATATFADVSGHRLLQSLVYPDGVTSAVYGYDAAGDLTSVGEPSYDAAGDRPYHGFGYQALGSGMIMYYVTSARWNGSDGGYMLFGFLGSSLTSSTLSTIGHVALVNPAIPDGTNAGQLQSGYATGAVQYNSEWYGTGGTNPWFHDSDGHSTNWVVDSLGRPTQTQECSEMSGWTCTGVWLVSNQTWDSLNNLWTQTDPRGNQTGYIYDPSGNTIAIGEPVTTTSQGTFKPTKIYDYDTHNNIVGYCDENESHAKGADWTGPYASVYANDALCATYGPSVAHWQATYSYPSNEPFGEMTVVTTPLGYHRTLQYNATPQAGADYGLPTDVIGDAITQNDGTSRQPHQAFVYDANGNVVCYQSNANDVSTTSIMTYDALGRVIAGADADDASTSHAFCNKTPSLPGSTIVTHRTYNADGSIASQQTPSEAAAGVATQFTYDADGNTTSVFQHYAYVAGGTAPPPTTKWYDGADRLVEVAYPHDASDYYSFAFMERYFYDLSQGGTNAIGTVTGIVAHGNLFKTQEFIGPSVVSATIAATPPQITGSWKDIRGDSHDALDRLTAKYDLANGTAPLRTNYYDGAGSAGLLSSIVSAPSGSQTAYTYDGQGRVASIQFTTSGAPTPNETYLYDADGHDTTLTSSVYGPEQRTYDAEGRVLTDTEPTTGVSSPAVTTSTYYPDGLRSTLSVSSSALTQQNLLVYSYRGDGRLQREHLNSSISSGDFSWQRTGAGRLLSQSDPLTGTNALTPFSYPNQVSLVPKSATYDSTGRLSSYTIPSGVVANAFSFDAEGEVRSYTTNPDQGNTPATHHIFYNNRGEVFAQSQQGGSGGTDTLFGIPYNVMAPHFVAASANGFMVRLALDCGGAQIRNNPCPTGTTQFDAFDGRPYANIAGTRYWAHTNAQYDTGGRLTSETDSEHSPDGDCSGSVTRTYDVENRVVQAAANNYNFQAGSCLQQGNVTATSSYGWGPNGHPITVGQYTIHWDGDKPLFVTNGSGTLVSIRLGGLGGVNALANFPTLLVYDRDWNGITVSLHDPGTGIRYLGTAPYSSDGFASMMTLDDSPITDPAADGFWDGMVVFQGARSYDPSLGTWTTPDPYPGNVHDPASQKPYMWNRNNAFAYSDPSGFTSRGCSSIDCTSEPGWGSPDDGAVAGAGNEDPLQAMDRLVADAGQGFGFLQQDIETAIGYAFGALYHPGMTAQDFLAAGLATYIAKILINKGYDVTSVISASNVIFLKVVDKELHISAQLGITNGKVTAHFFDGGMELDRWRINIFWENKEGGRPMIHRQPWPNGVNLPAWMPSAPYSGIGSG